MARTRFLANMMLLLVLWGTLSGCGGGDRDPLVAAPALGVIQLSVTANGPATMVFPATWTYQVRLSNTKDNTAVKSNAVTAAGSVLTVPTTTLADVTPGQFLVDIVSASDSKGAATTTISAPMFKTYFVQSYGNGAVSPVNLTIGMTETAKAMSYANWPSAKTKTIEAFNPATASLTALAATMTTHLNKSSGAVTTSFKWTPAIASLALALGKATP